ncbi:MAG TPA: four helix bundle protein, partial [Saprospirales bacterium]|nr:four helix bundle protein [Saprospirales bacterium]
MKTITRFEDLHCWKAARILVKHVYLFSHNGPLANDWVTRSQLRRAALSIMNNIAEGFGRFSTKDSIRFLDIAKASCNEVKSMLYLFEDIEYLPSEIIQQLHEELDSAAKLTNGFIRYLNNKLQNQIPKPPPKKN